MKKKRQKNLINLLMGIRFTALIKLGFKHGLSINPLYLVRFLLLVPTSLMVEIFILIENIKNGRKIRETLIEKPPVFIIGHWRSGTTFLHQLIYLDKQFTAPTVVQSIIPEHLVFSTKYWVPILDKTMPSTRPMDEVEMKALGPMEDEWALLRMGAPTPFIKVFFPSSGKRFIRSADEFIPSGRGLEKWKKSIVLFLKKITLVTRRRIVLKNPGHTPRMELLSSIFPGAGFIHIVRHPYKIVPSAINMWNIVAAQNAFRPGWKEPSVEETASLVDDFWKHVEKARNKIPGDRFAEVRYEDLEKDPVKELKRIYGILGFRFTDELENNILGFKEEKKNYRKNLFHLSRGNKDSINKILEGYMKNYGYNAE